ncbi:alpha/beta fold hydrolase [Rhodobacteraceae bacterium 2376]|uniref:Alpha/beta fold hydrolase n=1 Tax=Rhabdonatronobacter sediminivivens TaxID=2743469 RepID=A0A7Z0HWH7_9RHOB|nr:alpha/beta fold hydrolase [Rhabdonatronobacter sediminivivens]NYS23626.1 alpha/beta fold hydrolase [Rhabdonatronobacter sediminivivens]
MTRELQSGRRGAAQGRARSVVVFVHGYGADGADLLGLAEPLAPHLPDTAFYAPDAPDPCTNNPMGYQWFPIPWLDGSSEAAAQAGLLQAADDLNAFVDRVLADEGLPPEALALVGFSQGTMMSLQIAPRRAAPVAGVVGFSGRLMRPEALGAETVSRPPVLLIHGDADEVVPVQSLPEAAQALQGAGFEVYGHVSKGTGHGIAPDGLSLALSFLRDKLPGYTAPGGAA